MKWFGPNAWAPVCEPSELTETPTGQPCLHCDEPIVLGDSGFVMPMWAPASDEDLDAVWNGKPTRWRITVYHRECFFRGVSGGPEHQLGQCQCGTNPRLTVKAPENMTLRQEAQWVWDWVHRMKVH